MQEWQKKTLFGCYVIVSTVAMIVKFNQLCDTSPNFYVLGARLSTGNSLIIITNMLIMSALLIGKFLQFLIFGELRLIELEHLYEKLWPTIIGLLFSANAYQGKENSFSRISLFVGLLFSKVFHCILNDRLDSLIQRYYQSNNNINNVNSINNNNQNNFFNLNNPFIKILFNRITLSLFIFLKLDISIIKACIDESFINKSAILLVIAFEFFLLTIDLAYASIKFFLNVFEIYYVKIFPDEEVWPYKIWIDSLTKVILGTIRCIMIPVLFTFFTLMEVIPLNLINEIFRSYYDLYKLTTSFFRLIKSSKKLNDSLKLPTIEDLKDNEICIICRDDMILNGTGNSRSIPKKLQCGHILHDGCIRSWLEMSNACPTCRKEVFQNNNSNLTNILPIEQNVEPVIEPVQDVNEIEQVIPQLNPRANENENNENENNNNNEINENNNGNNHMSNIWSSARDEYHSESEANDETEEEEAEQEEEEVEEEANQEGRNLYFENDTQTNNSNNYNNTKHHEITRQKLSSLKNVMNGVSLVSMSAGKRDMFNRVNYNLDSIKKKIERNQNGRREEEEVGEGEGGGEESSLFELNLPENSNIPRDWTLFPIKRRKGSNQEYDVRLGLNKRVKMNIVQNDVNVDKDTFDKYVIKK